ncbi:hypothetical protein L6164_017865 [Bauhinia variegata]|uniref:Uncharacterized protein n=1 Tax=Bauhinia variegata TaxID=167791 RepID=A0ACB9N9G9_BAUVA|nr:hypothetical protein L6164_017865 [Bauhinia variegata]
MCENKWPPKTESGCSKVQAHFRIPLLHSVLCWRELTLCDTSVEAAKRSLSLAAGNLSGTLLPYEFRTSVFPHFVITIALSDVKGFLFAGISAQMCFY